MQTTNEAVSASEAIIKTATIEVKVMKIGNRQVTLSVFRQLKSESIIDFNTGEMRGIPWGQINYHVDCDGLDQNHLHVVWQEGNELRRSIAFLPWERSPHATRSMRSFLTPTYDTFIRWYGVSRLEMINHTIAARLKFGNGGKLETFLESDDTPSEDKGRIKKILRWIDADMDVIAKWQQSYSQLKQLDQLFIAV